MKKLITISLSILNMFIPKSRNRVAFISRPNYSDGPKNMCEYLRKQKQYKLYFLTYKNHGNTNYSQKKDVKFINANSLKGFLAFSRAKYVFVSQGDFNKIKSRRQLYVNLWHGTPIKSLYNTVNYSKKEHKKNIHNWGNTKWYVSSNFVMNLYKACFMIPSYNIKVLGQPRNDSFSNVSINKIIPFKESYDKVILYAPTYRESDTQKENNLFGFEKYSDADLDEFLEKNNILLICKLHPRYEKRITLGKFNTKNKLLLDTATLQNSFIDLNDLIPDFDLLITDFSSIAFDFLYHSKNTIFLKNTDDEYATERGFTIENDDLYIYGPKANNWSELKSAILSKPDFDKMSKFYDIYYKYPNDNNNCKRVWNDIIEVKK